ncbi:MAG: response regulator transcription factor [Cyanobacteria bacterium SZAS LIN-3]|nr:response regulator transcription factor [Cyanobacteria bacterium SZAS LIN-3]MBS2006219.1 response regulator transcription factor [Cyanobacteria bacterium SZAS TMP-1]
MAKVLVVEDDTALQRMISDWLTLEHYSLELAGDGKDALEKLKFYQYDVVILDWQLPGMSGIEVIREYRSAGGKTPVLMLTGKSTIPDKEEGFDSGVDDYLTKPFHMKELSARLRALLRRPTTLVTEVLEYGALHMDRRTHVVLIHGKAVDLKPTEYALLEFLMRHPGQVFAAEVLLDRVWSSQSDSSVDALTTCIKRLRKKISVEGQESIIKTVYGVGYKLEL